MLGIACREVSDSAELPAARRVQAVLLDDAVGTCWCCSRRASCWTSPGSPN